MEALPVELGEKIDLFPEHLDISAHMFIKSRRIDQIEAPAIFVEMAVYIGFACALMCAI